LPVSRNPPLTHLLERAEAGDPAAASAILPLVYEELRKLAHAWMAREPAGHTLQPTALVHEAYLRLLGNGDVRWGGRRHFFAAAANAMRRILVERARRVATKKRGGGGARIPLEEADLRIPEEPEDVIALDAALERLMQADRRKYDVVMLRFFSGLTIEETARVLDVSAATVKSDWSFARAWLLKEIGPREG
jgi:RNA polymerase sigma factor (TIGR02999 family)